MSNLKTRETFIMSGNEFSKGLFDVVTLLTSLRKLEISYCKLPTLPERLAKKL